jgi:bacillithiol system protein YtxJ
MVLWKSFNMQHQLQDIIRESYHHPVFIFKHSRRCNVSSIAKMRLEDHWDPTLSPNSEIYFLDVISHPDLSDEIASYFQVYHESPQILIIQNGECLHDASHFDITVDEIREVI